MQSPLLQPINSQEAGSNPNLSWSNADEICDDSHFSRLIALSASIDAHTLIPPPDANALLLAKKTYNSPCDAKTNLVACSKADDYRHLSIRGVLVIGFFWCLHGPLVFGALMCDSLFEVHSITNSNATSVNSTTTTQDCITYQSTGSVSLASFTATLSRLHQFASLCVILFSGLVIPCVVTLFVPLIAFHDLYYPFNMNTRIRTLSFMSIIELLPRFSFILIYVFMLLFSLGSIHSTNDKSHVSNINSKSSSNNLLDFQYAPQTSLVSFAVGSLCAVLATCSLRRCSAKALDKNNDNNCSSLISLQPFDLTIPLLSIQDDDKPIEDMATLEDTQDVDIIDQIKCFDLSTCRQPLLACMSVSDEKDEKLPYWKSLIVSDVALLAVFLAIPAVYLPIYHLQYTGLAEVDRGEETTSLFLWQFVEIFWRQLQQSNTSLVVSLLLLFVWISTTIVVPCVVITLCVLVWTCESTSPWYTKLRHWIYWLQPALGGTVFACALLVTAPIVSPWMKELIQTSIRHHNNVQKFHYCQSENDNDCISIDINVAIGSYVYLLQSSLLELFVGLVLLWSPRSTN